jgi:hypothetical protein
MTDRPLFLETAGDCSHVKEQADQNEATAQKVDLADRYQEIGISAVAAALRCQKEKKPNDWRQKRKIAASGAPVDLRNIRLSLRTKDFRSLDEKRAYYRLLRHLLSEKLQASYKEDQARPLPPKIVDVLKTLGPRKPPETH